MNIFNELKNDEVANYFINLGFTVSWDFSKSGDKWYEISRDGQLLVQFDMGPPLEVILTEIYAESSGIPTKKH